MRAAHRVGNVGVAGRECHDQVGVTAREPEQQAAPVPDRSIAQAQAGFATASSAIAVGFGDRDAHPNWVM